MNFSRWIRSQPTPRFTEAMQTVMALAPTHAVIILGAIMLCIFLEETVVLTISAGVSCCRRVSAFVAAD